MTDVAERLIEGFAKGIHSLPFDVLNSVNPEVAFDWGQRAAATAVAPVVWARAAGEVLETSEVQNLLGVSRQALAKRIAVGSLIGLPAKGRTLFPVWQFDLDEGRVRTAVRAIIEVFRESLGEVDPNLIAAWATTPQDEDLDGSTPASWLAENRDIEVVVESARRLAARMAT
jgi:hypothetical protein